MRAHVDQSSLFGYFSPATGEVTSHPPLCACGACAMPVESFKSNEGAGFYGESMMLPVDSQECAA